MSQENVEIARRVVDAFNEVGFLLSSDPFPTLREFCDPDVEWNFSRRGVDPEIYHGYDGWLRIAEQFRDAWREIRMEVEEIIDAGESVVVFVHTIGLSRSGIKLSVRVGHVVTVRDGKI